MSEAPPSRSHGSKTPRKSAGVAASAGVHEEVARRLASVRQRYTSTRRELVETLARAGRPLTVPEILGWMPSVPQSSAYRTVVVLADAGVVERIEGADDHGRFELTEDIAGHHHHLVCEDCGQVADVEPSGRLERALDEAARAAVDELGYDITSHRFDLVGRCPDCQPRGR